MNEMIQALRELGVLHGIQARPAIHVQSAFANCQVRLRRKRALHTFPFYMTVVIQCVWPGCGPLLMGVRKHVKGNWQPGEVLHWFAPDGIYAGDGGHQDPAKGT